LRLQNDFELKRQGDDAMNIGQAASASGVTAKMIRYYESIGLIAAADRTQAGYRVYSSEDIHALRFIKRARNMGFSMDEARELLALWRDKTRASADVKSFALKHVRELEAKIAELQAMAQTIKHLANNCHGDDRPDCPILADIADVAPSRKAANANGKSKRGTQDHADCSCDDAAPAAPQKH
jgi:MerR family copper efflux transcriptional regulator